MKFLIVACLVACACADVSHILPKNGLDEKKAEIVAQELDTSPDGTYIWSYRTSNGIEAAAKGDINKISEGEASQSVQGQAGWTSPEGEVVSLQYIADENGYQPQGSHLPTPPSIPEYIIRALEYIRTHPPAPEK